MRVSLSAKAHCGVLRAQHLLVKLNNRLARRKLEMCSHMQITYHHHTIAGHGAKERQCLGTYMHTYIRENKHFADKMCCLATRSFCVYINIDIKMHSLYACFHRLTLQPQLYDVSRVVRQHIAGVYAIKLDKARHSTTCGTTLPTGSAAPHRTAHSCAPHRIERERDHARARLTGAKCDARARDAPLHPPSPHTYLSHKLSVQLSCSRTHNITYM